MKIEMEVVDYIQELKIEGIDKRVLLLPKIELENLIEFLENKKGYTITEKQKKDLFPIVKKICDLCWYGVDFNEFEMEERILKIISKGDRNENG